MYSMDSRKNVELLQNVEAFGVQSVGYPFEIILTPIPTRTMTFTPLPSPTRDNNLPFCSLGESFVDEENKKLNGFLDFIGGACTTSDRSVNILFNLREIPDYLDLNETGNIEYQILLKPPLGRTGTDYLIKIIPIENRTNGSMDHLFICIYGEYIDRKFGIHR